MGSSKGSKKSKVIQNPLSYYNPKGVEVGGLIWGDGIAATDLESMKRASARYFGPRKQNEVRQELNESKQELRAVVAKMALLEAAIAKEARIKQSSRAAGLRRIVHELKRAHQDHASDASFLASKVDAILKWEKRQLHTICPRSWKEYVPTDRLVDLLNPKLYPKLHKLVKSYISKA